MKLIPEWYEHQYCLIAWPCNKDLYGEIIDSARDGYLITQKKEIIHSGLSFKGFGSCILDGEYITQNRDGNSALIQSIKND